MGVPSDEAPAETPSSKGKSKVLKPQRSSQAMVIEVVKGPSELNVAEVAEFLEIKVVLDSGAGAHVMNKRDCPGYEVKESPMTKSGAAFKAANGTVIKNYGEVRVEMVAKDSHGGVHNISSKFEAADVTRALWSVGLICDAGLDVKFTKTRASVVNPQGVEVCAFHRENGLYVAAVKIRNPKHADFQRPGH